MESLDHGDAAMLIDGAEPRQYVTICAPLLFKVRTFEFAALIDNEVFWFRLGPFNQSRGGSR